MIRIIFLSGWAALLAIFCPSISAKIPLEHYLPEDTWLAISAERLSDMTAEFKESELSSKLGEDEWDALLAPLKANPYWAHLSNLTVSGEPLTWDMFVEKHPERVLLAFIGDETAFGANPEFKFLAIADYVGDIEFMLDISTPDLPEGSDVEIKVVEQDYLGTTLYLEEIVRGEEATIDSGWTVIDGLYMEASPVSLLKETVDLVLDGSHERSLAENPVYIDAQAEWGDSQIHAFLNLAAIVPLFQDSSRKNAIQLPPNPLGLSTENLFSALKLDNLDSLYAGIASERDGLRLRYGALYKGLDGVLSLLSYTEEDLFKTSFTPPDAMTASISNFSLTQAWHALEDILSDVSPNFDSFYQMQLNQLNATTDIDIRESIIENFGEQFIVLTLENKDSNVFEFGDETVSPAVTNQCFIIEILDTHSFEMAVEALKDMVSQGTRVFESRDFMGTRIYTPVIRQGQSVHIPTTSYAIKDGYFLFATGSPAALEPVIINMEKDGAHLFAKDSIQDALVQLPRNPYELQYNNIGMLWKNMLRNVDRVANGIGGELPLFRLGTIERDVDLPYFFLGGTYVDDNRLSFEALVRKQADDDD